MRKTIFTLLLLLAGTLSQAQEVKLTLLQLNDVYEMTPVNGGQYGGLARVQTIIKALKAENPNTYTILAGDLVSPSAIGNANVNGHSLAGQQMVDVLNHMQWDFVTFGNHEFDIGRSQLLKRLKEAHFKIFSSNVLDSKTNKPFRHTEKSIIFTVEGVRIGLIGVTISKLSKDFVRILEPLTQAQAEAKRLKTKKKVDIVILVTHLAVADDIKLAEQIPEADLIIGGHEHENLRLFRGSRFTPITKADANARSAYIHRLTFNQKQQRLRIDSEFKIIDDKIDEDPMIARVVQTWIDKAFAAFRQEGFEAEQIIANTPVALDGLESSVRNHSTRLTELVADSALQAFEDCEISIVNGGSIRIDDIIPPGPVRQYDVLRILPFGGTYSKIKLPGSLLKQALEVGANNQGKGGFLHYRNIQKQNNQWRVNGQPLDINRDYITSIVSFLIDSGDEGLGFLVKNPAIHVFSDKPVDARFAMVAAFKRTYGNNINTRP